MKILDVGSRSRLAVFGPQDSPFEMPTGVFVVRCHERIFVCDTHCGNRSMELLREALDELTGAREIVVVNTHFDFDHVWGNGAFPGSTIVAHRECRETLADDAVWDGMMQQFGDSRNGDVERRLPDLTFTGDLRFETDGIALLHTPGHTEDSISVLDEDDSTLFVADCLEDPIPFVQTHRLELYLQTLDRIEGIGARKLVTSHSGCVEPDLIDSTRDYLKLLQEGREFATDDPWAVETHSWNLRYLRMSRTEDEARRILGEDFTRSALFEALGPAMSGTIEQLDEACRSFLDQLVSGPADVD